MDPDPAARGQGQFPDRRDAGAVGRGRRKPARARGQSIGSDRRGQGFLGRCRSGGGAHGAGHQPAVGKAFDRSGRRALPDHCRAERNLGGRRLWHGAGLRSAHSGAGRQFLLSGDAAWLFAATVRPGPSVSVGWPGAGKDDLDGGNAHRRGGGLELGSGRPDYRAGGFGRYGADAGRRCPGRRSNPCRRDKKTGAMTPAPDCGLLREGFLANQTGEPQLE